MSLKTLQMIDGELVIQDGSPVWLTGAKAVRQRLENRLSLWKGDWFLDPELGIDWLDILDGAIDLQRLKVLIKNTPQ